MNTVQLTFNSPLSTRQDRLHGGFSFVDDNALGVGFEDCAPKQAKYGWLPLKRKNTYNGTK